MKPIDDELAELLSQARRALSPSAADEARVLQRTLRAAGVTAGPAASTLLAGKLVMALSIAGVSGAVGFVLGRQVERDAGARAVPVVVAAARNPERAIEAVPVEAAPEPPVAVEEPAPLVARSPRRAPTHRSAPLPVAAEPVAEVREEPSSSLELEVRLMKTVERALREGDPGRALRGLDQLDQEVPQGSLGEERLAASVIARCRLGLGSRAKLIEEFSSQYANSGYAQRVQTSCRTRP